MTSPSKGPQGIWQRENESNNDYAIRLVKEIRELSGVKN